MRRRPRRSVLAAERQQLAMPQPNPLAREAAEDFMRRVAVIEIGGCPHCKLGRWQVLQQVAADWAAMAAITRTAFRDPV